MEYIIDSLFANMFWFSIVGICIVIGYIIKKIRKNKKPLFKP